MLMCVLVPAAEEVVPRKRDREPSWTSEDLLDESVAGKAVTPKKRASNCTTPASVPSKAPLTMTLDAMSGSPIGFGFGT